MIITDEMYIGLIGCGIGMAICLGLKLVCFVCK